MGNLYVGVGGTARKVNGIYVGVNGTARKVLRGYVGVNGTARMFYDGTAQDEPAPPWLTFSSPSDFQLSINDGKGKNWDGTLEWSTDNTPWTIWDGAGPLSSAGGKLYLRGTGNTILNARYQAYPIVSFALDGADVSCEGNIETLLDYSTVEQGRHPAMAMCCFAYLFRGCTALKTAPALPATELTMMCYYSMFAGCTALETPPPVLPATQLANSCYSTMFARCTSLKIAPALLATNGEDDCCQSMFLNCESLRLPPALPATTLGSRNYAYMFSGCTALVALPALPCNRLASDCYANMFAGCTGVGLWRSSDETHPYRFRMPPSEGGSGSSSSMTDMFKDAGGEVVTPAPFTVYYTTAPMVE